MIRRKEEGFTLVELVLASAFFSFILLFVITSFIQINRSYTRGITVKRVQDASRSLMEDITRNLRQTSAGNITINDSTSNFRLCLGNGVRYGWNEYLGSNYTQETASGESFAIVRVEDSAGSCGDSIAAADASQLLPEDVAVQNLDVTPIGGSSYRVRIVLSTEDLTGIVNPGDGASCDVGIGDQFCDIAVLETVVSVRN